MRVLGMRLALAGALGWGVFATAAHGVENAPVKIGERWAVVGVIAGTDAGGKPIGIAVLKNSSTKRTYTVSLGDTVPTEFGFVLSAVHDRQVEISDGRQKIMLGFAEGSAKDEEDDNDRTARFLDNYYRSLGGNRLEVLAGDEPGAEVPPPEDADTGGVLPLKRFGSLKEEGDSRFELYRPDRTYRFGPEREGDSGTDSGSGDAGDGGEVGEPGSSDDGSFAVRYDNFDEPNAGDGGADAVDAETGEPLFEVE